MITRLTPVLVLALCFGSSALAQNTPEPAATYTLRFWAAGVAPGGANYVQQTVFPASAVQCGRPKIATPPGVVVNPNTVAWDDPADATKDCVVALDQAVTIFAVPVGPYSATVQAVGATTGPSQDSAVSNPFARAVVLVPPRVPSHVRLLRP